MTTLAGSRLILRELSLEDADAVNAYLSDIEVIRYMTFTEQTLDDTRLYVEEAMAEAAAEERHSYVLAVTLAYSGDLIGTGNLTIRSAEDRRAAIGWVFHPDHWGHGYATETAALLVDFGFGDLGLHRIEALCDPANAASARVMEKAGMVREGHLRDYLLIRGEWCDCLIYSALAPA